MIEFTLPWPPSVNRMWRNITVSGKPRTLLSAEGRLYRLDCFEAILDQRVPRLRMNGSLFVSIKAFPPDNRARDIDNIFKGPLDALQHFGVIENDSCIDKLEIIRREKKENAEILVSVCKLEEE